VAVAPNQDGGRVRQRPRRGKKRYPEMAECVLRAGSVNKRFGGLQALSGVEIQIEAGQIYGLIGPNGAGKDDVLQRVDRPRDARFGHVRAVRSSVLADRCASGGKVGIARTFQNIRLFPDMTRSRT